MLGRSRRTTAVFVLGVAVSPWLSAGVVTLHLGRHSGNHHHEQQQDAAVVAVHGHSHEPGTPDHQHVLTLPAAAPAPARVALAPLPAALARMVADATFASMRLLAAVGGVGHDPPSVQRSFSILRI